MRYHEDARRRFWGDLFELPNGDLNVVELRPGVTIAWHRHQHQDDHLKLLSGDLLVQALDADGCRHRWSLDAEDAGPVRIPRCWWHGYQSDRGALLVQFNGPGKWDGTDEERHAITADGLWAW